MKSVGETMAIGRTFKEALQKAMRSLEIDRYGLGSDGNLKMESRLRGLALDRQREALEKALREPREDRIFYLYLALCLGWFVERVHELTSIDPWFLAQIKEIVEAEEQFVQDVRLNGMNAGNLRKMKGLDFLTAR
jgi:carbamoyl-phosphate synthase large subunit